MHPPKRRYLQASLRAILLLSPGGALMLGWTAPRLLSPHAAIPHLPWIIFAFVLLMTTSAGAVYSVLEWKYKGLDGHPPLPALIEGTLSFFLIEILLYLGLAILAVAVFVVVFFIRYQH